MILPRNVSRKKFLFSCSTFKRFFYSTEKWYRTKFSWLKFDQLLSVILDLFDGKFENTLEDIKNRGRWPSILVVNIGSLKIAPSKIAPPPPRKLPPMKIAPYENTYLWKFPPLKIAPLKITPKKITPRKLTPRKLSPLKVATIVVRNWKLLPCGPYVVMKNKAWWPVWWKYVEVQIPI